MIAAFGSALAEVGAVVIVGGNIENYDQTLASAVLYAGQRLRQLPVRARDLSIVLLALILVLMALLTVLQQRTAGIQSALPDRLTMQPALGESQARRAA